MINKDQEQEILTEISSSPSPQHPSITTTIELDDKEKEQEKKLEKKDFISLVFNNKTASEKYKKDLIDKASKDPRSVQIKTPKGWMTVKESIEAGYDPATGEFTKKGLPPINVDKALAGMPPEDASKLKGMMDPKNMQVNPEQLEEAGGKNMFGQFGKAKTPPPTPKLGGEEPVLGQDPNTIPTEEPGAPGTPDLSNILGGGGVNG